MDEDEERCEARGLGRQGKGSEEEVGVGYGREWRASRAYVAVGNVQAGRTALASTDASKRVHPVTRYLVEVEDEGVLVDEERLMGAEEARSSDCSRGDAEDEVILRCAL